MAASVPSSARQAVFRAPAAASSLLLRLALALLAAFLLPSLCVAAIPLDGFNIHNAGSVTISGPVEAVAVQPKDGKILIGGNFTLTDNVSFATRTNLARLNVDGSLDEGFVPPVLNGPVYAILLQPDPVLPENPELVVVGGSFTSAGGTPRKGLARLSATGALDGFNPVDTGAPVRVNALALQPGGGGIVVGGVFSEIKSGVPTRNLVGIAVAGAGSETLNWTYSGGLANDAGNVEVNAVALQDGMVLAGGTFVTPGSTNLVRFRSDGAYDAGFTPAAPGGRVRALAVQVDGMILVGGDFSAGALGRNYLARLKADGSADSFDAGLDVNGGSYVASILVQPDGKIVAGGNFALSTLPGAQKNIARFKISGARDASLFPLPDAAIGALALQGDGKVVAGGSFTNFGVRPRTRLARFYPKGTLDDDVSVNPDFGVQRATRLPDAGLVLSGLFTQLLGQPKMHLAKLREEDWSFDPTFSSTLSSPQNAYSIAPRPDNTFLMGGDFVTINGQPFRKLVSFDAAGVPGPASYNNNVALFINSVDEIMATILIPDGRFPENGMHYVGGILKSTASPQKYLARFKKTGEVDTTFVPPASIAGRVNALALQPDNTLLVGTHDGVLIRLRSDGTPDPTWNGGAPIVLSGPVKSVVLLPDGRVMASGEFEYPTTIVNPDTLEEETLYRNMLRFSSGGVVDDGFLIEGRFTYDEYGFGNDITGFALQADGGMVLYGVFDRVRDGKGNEIYREYVARVKPDGGLDTDYDLGSFSFASETPIGQVASITLQQDGKIIVAGEFESLVKKKLARYSNGHAAQELRVSDDGTKVTWLRSGSSPELWRASFEASADPDAAPEGWTLLGEGHRVPGGWELDGLNLASLGTNQNRYVRARGYAAPERGSQGSFTENVALYYLKGSGKTTITVTAFAQQKFYGDPDPTLSYDYDPPLSGSDTFNGSLTRTGDNNVGIYSITRGTLSLPATYDLVFIGAPFTIKPKEIFVRANAQQKTYGDADPVLTYNPNPPLSAGDSFSGALARTGTENAGVYSIVQGTLALSANYTITFAGANFTVKKKDATVTAADASKIYGAADPAFTATGVGFLPADLAPAKITLGATPDPGIYVGTYVLRPSASDHGTGLLNNYTVTYKNGSFVIGPAPLEVRADNQTKAAGTANPLLTATLVGLVGTDTAASLGGTPLITTTATVMSPAGSYVIHAALGSISNTNYSYGFVDGLLTVTGKLPQEITFNKPRAKTFGDDDFDPGATATSGLTVGYSSLDTGIAQVVGGKVRVTAPGSTTLTASQPGDDIWAAAADVSQPLTVNPPPWNGVGFDGVDDLLRAADGPQLNFGGKEGFSIETWLLLDGTPLDGTGLVSKGVGGGAWSGYQLVLQQDRIAAEIGGGGSSVGPGDGLVGSTSLNDGRWHHVALVVNRVPGEATLYLDGRVEKRLSHPALAANPDNLEPLRIGTDRTGARFFRGSMDEVRLWATARTQEEIRGAISQIIDPAAAPELAAYFHLDEGDAGGDNGLFAVAPERTGFHGDATLQGFALAGAASNWVRSGAFLPLLETVSVTSLSETAAAAAIVVYPNYYPATDVGLCWKSSPGATLADTCSRSGSGTGPFAGGMTGLTPGATYYVRAYAVNTMGTAYGNEIRFQAAREAQSITLAIADRTYGDPDFAPGGTASSGLTVSYASSNSAVARVEDGSIRIVGAGTTDITASQEGDSRYDRAPDRTVSFTVHPAPLRVVAENKNRAYLTPNPELTFSYQGFVKGEQAAVLTGAPLLSTTATLSTAVGSYPITVNASSLSARNYSFVPVNGTLYVYRSCQEITFPALPDRTFGDPPFEIVASACSGLPLTFSSSDPSVAQVNGNVITITGAGNAVITASQQGTGDLEGAPDKTQTFIVHKSGQGVSFSSLAQKVVGDPPFELEATASSGLPVSYASSNPAVAVVSGCTVTVVGAGTTVITARQAGNGNYLPALPVSQPLTVAQEGIPPLLTLSTLSSGAVTSNPVLNVMGRASDLSGIASLTVNGVDLTSRASLFTEAVPLSEGENSITVAARDGQGNMTQERLSVTLDALAPHLSVAFPADNGVTDTAACSISGTVTGGSTVTLSVNGEALQLLPVSDGRFSGSAFLLEGVNTLELTAELSGRSSRSKRSVTFIPEGTSVAITEPAEDLRTEEQQVTLRGIAGNAVGVTLDVNGTIFTPELVEGTFLQQIPLPAAGEFRISASATAADGKSGKAFRNILRIERIPGDLDGDGSVNIQDASQLLRISLGLDPPSPQALAHGDVAPLVNGVPQPDGVIDVGDLLVLLRKIVGLVRF